jgi:uncharacterized FAD-dependent dehydrogenase
LKPPVVERGKDVRGRRRDLKAINVTIWSMRILITFGEGGAGTYSDREVVHAL